MCLRNATDNNDMFCFLDILSFLCCSHLVEKKKTYEDMREERDFFTSTPILFKS